MEFSADEKQDEEVKNEVQALSKKQKKKKKNKAQEEPEVDEKEEQLPELNKMLFNNQLDFVFESKSLFSNNDSINMFLEEVAAFQMTPNSLYQEIKHLA